MLAGLRRVASGGVAVIGLISLTLAVIPAQPAGAVVQRAKSVASPVASNTQLELSATGNGQGVTGFLSDTPIPPTTIYPVADGKPGFTADNESFAGVIIGSPTDNSPDVTLYCIDIRTFTYIGVGYQLGTWDSASVPNVGYVARLLTDYYPTTDEPVSLTNLDQKAAAVQAAIWFFSDSYVLSTSDPLYSEVAGIVSAVQKAGPLVEPPPPTLTITPTDLNGPAGSILGPYTVTSSAGAEITVTATGADMFTNPTASGPPLADPSTVPSGTQIWLKSDGSSSAVLQATAKATVPTGNVYLWDGDGTLPNNATDAQKLILSQTATLTSTVSATAEFLPAGSLTVTKTITGPAGKLHQGVTIQVTCDGVPQPDFVIPAGVAPGTYSKTYPDIPAGATCTVVEFVGVPPKVIVDPDGWWQQVKIPAGGTATANITDTYTFVPGNLTVTKSIEGPAAELQGTVTIRATCNGKVLTPDFTISAGSPAGEYSHTYTDIPAPSLCTVDEFVGVPPTLTVTPTPPTGEQKVTVSPGETALAPFTDTYDFLPGNLTVNKTIAGPAAGTQGQITISVTCIDVEGTPTTLPPFVIPAGTDPTPVPTHTYTDIPGNSKCTIIETQDGHTPAVAVARSGPAQVTIPPGGTKTVDLTDTYETGVLVVNKLIDGDAAGHQGPVTVNLSCVAPSGATTTLAFPISAGATGNQSTSFTVAGGSTCTDTEAPDGSTSTVEVNTNGTIGQTITVAADGTGTADVHDTYSFVTTDLTVNKTIAGPAAPQQGAVAIMATCVDPTGFETVLPDFVIPSGTAAGTVPHTYSGIAAGSTCTVTEVVNGSTATVDATVTGSPAVVAIPAGGASATITDTYTLAPGSLLVAKVIGGPLAGKQGAITIHAVCNGTAQSPDFVIPAGTPAGTVTHSFDGVPAGSVCTVTETSDGSATPITATVVGDQQQVTVPAGQVAVAALFDAYYLDPGSLVVSKSITGAAAGQQGEIGILVSCGGTEDFAFTIPAGTGAGTVSRSFGGLTPGAVCTVTETSNGTDSSLTVATVGSGQQVTIPANASVTAVLADSYSTLTTGTLAFTGSPHQGPRVVDFALVAGFTGGVLVLVETRTRRRKRVRSIGKASSDE